MKIKKTKTGKMLLIAIIALTVSSELFAQGNSQNNSNGLWYSKDGDTVATNREVLINKNLKVQGNATADSVNADIIKVGMNSIWLGMWDQNTGTDNNISADDGDLFLQSISGVNFNTILNANNSGKVGIGTTNPTEKLHIKDGSIYVEGEGQGIIVNEGGQKRVGLMKYYGREAGIWRVINQDFEIGRLDVPSLPGTPTTFTTDLYVAGNGFVGINTTNQLIFVL